MIKALIYSDLQTTESNERCFNNPDIPLQRYRVELFYKELRQIYDKHQCSALWDLGDTTDDRSAIPLPTLNVIHHGLSKFPKSEYNLKIIGNHEQYTRNTQIDAGCIFADTFKVFHTIDTVLIEEVVVILVSYPASYSDLTEKLKSALLKHRNKTIVILGHLDVVGAKMRSGISLAGIPIDIFSEADLTLLGHIHLPQKLPNNVFYVGSPFQQNFGESDEDKRVGILTINGNNISLEWIELHGFPKYLNVSWPVFKEKFNSSAEDRYNITLSSWTEYEEFFKHPHSSRISFSYGFDVESSTESGNKQAENVKWDLTHGMKLWIKTNPPESKKLEITESELLDVGLQVVEMK